MRSTSDSNKSLKKETPHLFMWFTNGNDLAPDIPVLPSNSRIDYIARLYEEYEKLEATNTPLYFVYMGRMLTEAQKLQMQDLAEGKPNLFVIDYDDFEKELEDTDISKMVKKRVANLCDSFLAHGNQKGTTKGIGDLVDYSRLALLYYSDVLHKISGKTSANGLVYRDFDVVLGQGQLENTNLEFGLTCSSTITKTIGDFKNKAISMGKLEESERLLSNENLEFCFDLFSKNEDLMTGVKLDWLKQKKTIVNNSFINVFQTKFQSFLSHVILENSLIAVSENRFEAFSNALNLVEAGATPYEAFKKSIRSLNDLKGVALHSAILLESQNYTKSFVVGNDETWKMTTAEQHNLTEKEEVKEDDLYYDPNEHNNLIHTEEVNEGDLYYDRNEHNNLIHTEEVNEDDLYYDPDEHNNLIHTEEVDEDDLYYDPDEHNNLTEKEEVKEDDLRLNRYAHNNLIHTEEVDEDDLYYDPDDTLPSNNRSNELLVNNSFVNLINNAKDEKGSPER